MDPEEPRQWKEKVLYNFIVISIPLLVLLIVCALPFIIQKQFWFLLTIAICAFSACIILFFYSSKIPFTLRSATVSLLIYMFALAVIFSVNPFVASREWLILFSIIASVLLGWPGAAVSILLNTIALFGIGVFIDKGLWSDLPVPGNPVAYWFQVALDIFFINVTSTLFVTYLFLRLEGSDSDARSTARLLEDERSKLQKANQDLEAEFAERKLLERQLSRAQKMQAIGTLAGGVAHDLNNILSGIVSYPDLLLQDLEKDSSLRDPLLVIKKSGEKAANIVQDLLTLARRGVDTRKVVSLNRIVKDFLISPEYSNILSPHDQVKVKTNLGENVLDIVGSEIHISKSIMNIVANAADAMPAGGELTITTASRYLDYAFSGFENIPEGEYTTLEISDNGIGMPKSDLERIFEPFYTRKVMGRSGTGLGMSVVWGTIKDHDGFIDIVTDEGSGTAFILYFPATRQEKEIVASVYIEDYLGRGESILVIDDSKEQRLLAGNMMKRLGYSVSAAASGEEALEMIREKRYDLIILDMIMEPGINGLQTYQGIIRIVPHQKAVIASGFSETDMVRETQRLGAGAYVKKPYTLEKIGLAVRSELDHRG
jgi:signal transduction histidine kinase